MSDSGMELPPDQGDASDEAVMERPVDWRAQRDAGAALSVTLTVARDALDQVVERADDVFRREDAAYLREVWPDAKADLDHLIEYVRITSDAQFERVGLGVRSGLGKRRSVEMWSRRVPLVLRSPGPVGRVVAKVLVQFSGVLNSLLGSILSEIPVAGEIAREFKEHVEHAALDRIVEEDDAEVRAVVEADRAAQRAALGDDDL